MSIISNAQPIIKFNENFLDKYIGKNTSIYQDKSRKLTINEINCNPNLFNLSVTEVTNFGLNDYNNWLKFDILNQTKRDKIILNISYPNINDITLYYILKGKIDSTHISEKNSIKNRLYEHQFFIFNIPVKRGELIRCYVKLSGNKQIMVPLTLDTDESLINYISITDIFSGVYFGIMFSMLIYNLFIYFSTKDRSYILYVNYIFWVTLTQCTLLGYYRRFLGIDNLWLINIIVPLTGALAGIATLFFSKSFLRTSSITPKLNLVLNSVIFIYLISIIELIFNKPLLGWNTVNVAAATGSLMVIYTAYVIYRKNIKSAKYFLLGFTIFLLFTCVFVFKDYGILPYNFVTIHSLQIGSAIESILLSFALANSINTLKKEKELSQAAALSALQENDRIIREQNTTLERKVKERTNELVSTNNNLNKTLTDLKEAQTQLVEAEKMASLGQLTAGIAHEINNPINFVTSNVGPLKRDVDMLVDAIINIESVGLSEATIEEKQQQIEDYKEEIDLDYLKIEINHLIHGIHEGATRTADIVKGLKIFSRLDEDDLKKADINEGLQSTLTIANNLIGDKIHVIKNFGHIPVIECFPGKLNQVFLNIISNAVFAVQEKFGNQPGGILKITTDNDNQYLIIKIEDNGTGMSEATKTKIFEPFFTTKNVGVGTGLGMSIVYNTIKKHNAEIYLNSTEGVGTEFIIRLNLVFTEPIADYQSEQQGQN